MAQSHRVRLLDLVTDKITETGVAGSQLQTIIADVFGGPG
jgi:hypothetical protein